MKLEREIMVVLGNRVVRGRVAGWEALFVSVDEHARIAYTELHPDDS
jgi:hypothetical protein